MKNSIIFIAILFLLTSCLQEDEYKKPFVSFVPEQISDGWQISSPDAENMDVEGLKAIYKDFHADKTIWQVRSLLVFRNGKLVAESYTKDNSDRTTPRAVWSCTKQVMGLLTGIALEKQIIKSVNDSISDYLSETSVYQDKKNIQIKDLLTMRSGIAYSNDGLAQSSEILRQLPPKITPFILQLKFKYNPGEVFDYKDGDPQLLSAIYQQKIGKPTSDWAKEVLFDLLEITHLDWDKYKDGTTFGAFGILTTPRELAKFGQCVLDSGQWKGRQIVRKEWIKEMTTVRIQKAYDYQFGYLWWKDTKRNMTFTWGHGGQYVCIIPNKKLIIVMTAEVNTQSSFQFSNHQFDWVDRIVKTAN
jgi:CubicO group peptidase (beta-lactamase class C family)